MVILRNKRSSVSQ